VIQILLNVDTLGGMDSFRNQNPTVTCFADSGRGLRKGSYDWLVRRVKYHLNSYFSSRWFKHRRSERICNEETTRQRERERDSLTATTTATEKSYVLVSVQAQRAVGSLDQLKKVLIA
jgi:hypothetical protein